MTDDAPTPLWLTPDQERAWIGVAALMWRLPGPLDAQLMRDGAMTLFEYFVLSQLSMNDRRAMRMSELAAVANSQPSRLSNVVARLERRGWVVRETDTGDRRGTVATLTEAGYAAVVAAAPGHVAAVRRLVIDRLTSEQVQAMADIGAAVSEAVDADRARRGPSGC